MIELFIQNEQTIYQPIVEDGITWETERENYPGKLTFKVIKDGIVNYQEGNPTWLKVDGKEVFYGYVFEKKRDKDHFIDTIAYDQLRYLKNKDNISYTDMTASEVIQYYANEYKLKIGELEDTKMKIPQRRDTNSTLFDAFQTALDLTMVNTGDLYVLYDDYGKLVLKHIKNMRLDLLIDAETAENFEYTSSIDTNTYNRIRLVYDNDGKGEKYEVSDPANIERWGLLQYYERINTPDINLQNQADEMLNLYNQKTRQLSVRDCLGDIRVRAGSMVAVDLNLGDIIARTYMLVEKAKHKFSSGHHTMDLQLVGGNFIA